MECVLNAEIPLHFFCIYFKKWFYYKMECIHCEKKFSTKSNLNQHQRTSKLCLLKQGKNEKEDQCTTCGKMYVTRYIGKHVEKCEKKREGTLVKELQKQLNEKNKEIKRKDKTIKDIAMKAVSAPKVINNNKYECLVYSGDAFSPAYIKKQVDEKFDESYFMQGQRGVAYFANDNLLQNVETGEQYYYCSDVSRKVFVMKDKDGKVEKDYKGVKLLKKIAGNIVTKSKCIYTEGIRMIDRVAERERETYRVVENKKHRYLTNLCDIEKIESNNNGMFVRTLSSLVCGGNDDVVAIEDDDNLYLIEE